MPGREIVCLIIGRYQYSRIPIWPQNARSAVPVRRGSPQQYYYSADMIFIILIADRYNSVTALDFLCQYRTTGGWQTMNWLQQPGNLQENPFQRQQNQQQLGKKIPNLCFMLTQLINQNNCCRNKLFVKTNQDRRRPGGYTIFEPVTEITYSIYAMRITSTFTKNKQENMQVNKMQYLDVSDYKKMQIWWIFSRLSLNRNAMIACYTVSGTEFAIS